MQLVVFSGSTVADLSCVLKLVSGLTGGAKVKLIHLNTFCLGNKVKSSLLPGEELRPTRQDCRRNS